MPKEKTMRDEQLTWIAGVKDILEHQSELEAEGEAVALDEAYGQEWKR